MCRLHWHIPLHIYTKLGKINKDIADKGGAYAYPAGVS